jgi:predicted nucleotide-binding protein
MARSVSQARPAPAVLLPDDMRQAIPRLQKRLDAVTAFDPNVPNEEAAERLTQQLQVSIEEALSRTFGSGTIEYNRYVVAAYFDWPHSFYEATTIMEIRDALRQKRQRSIDLIQAAIDTLIERLSESEFVKKPTTEIKVGLSENRKVFVVHGHDVAARQSVARFLEKLNFLPIILSERPNQGRTIIEKFESNADVGFAVVILTPDDEGSTRGTPPLPRARQNVILELGYFIGKLGRSRVCALKAPGVEIPSDILGVVWTDYDNVEHWKQGLAKELQAANYDIDWNKIMGM